MACEDAPLGSGCPVLVNAALSTSLEPCKSVGELSEYGKAVCCSLCLAAHSAAATPPLQNRHSSSPVLTRPSDKTKEQLRPDAPKLLLNELILYHSSWLPFSPAFPFPRVSTLSILNAFSSSTRMFAFACRLTRLRPAALSYRPSFYCSFSTSSPAANMTAAALLGSHAKKHKVTIVGSGNW